MIVRLANKIRLNYIYATYKKHTLNIKAQAETDSQIYRINQWLSEGRQRRGGAIQGKQEIKRHKLLGINKISYKDICPMGNIFNTL